MDAIIFDRVHAAVVLAVFLHENEFQLKRGRSAVRDWQRSIFARAGAVSDGEEIRDPKVRARMN